MAQEKRLVVPSLGESITEAVIGKWLVNVGDVVQADDPIVDLETDKITQQIPAPVSGALTEQLFSEGDTVKVGDIVGAIDPSVKAEKKQSSQKDNKKSKKADKAEKQEDPAKPEPKPETKRQQTRPEPSPSGSNGASSIPDDVLAKLTPAQRRQARLDGGVPVNTAEPTVVDDVVTMSPLRKRIAERLVQAQHESASLTTFNEVDMTAVMALRSDYKEQFLERYGVKLGFMSFFAKACVAACKEYPGVNAEIQDDAIVFKKRYDFGIAVSTEKGLVVPVLRHVDELSFAEIELGIGELATKARSSKLTLNDLVGGTFTITNGGIYGSMMSTPLLNYPQTGILGMHNIVKRPMVVGDEVEVRPMMYIALTYDHRVVDGREAVSFLVAVKKRLESPDRLLIDI